MELTWLVAPDSSCLTSTTIILATRGFRKFAVRYFVFISIALETKQYNWAETLSF